MLVPKTHVAAWPGAEEDFEWFFVIIPQCHAEDGSRFDGRPTQQNASVWLSVPLWHVSRMAIPPGRPVELLGLWSSDRQWCDTREKDGEQKMYNSLFSGFFGHANSRHWRAGPVRWSPGWDHSQPLPLFCELGGWAAWPCSHVDPETPAEAQDQGKAPRPRCRRGLADPLECQCRRRWGVSANGPMGGGLPVRCRGEAGVQEVGIHGGMRAPVNICHARRSLHG